MHKSGSVIKMVGDYTVAAQTLERQKAPSVTMVEAGVRVSPALLVPKSERTRARFIPLARWEGHVIEMFASYFSAEVIRLDSEEAAYVEFDLDDVAQPDRDICQPGALFYWSVGYDVKPQGQRSRSSILTFRRLGHTAIAQ